MTKSASGSSFSNHPLKRTFTFNAHDERYFRNIRMMALGRMAAQAALGGQEPLLPEQYEELPAPIRAEGTRYANRPESVLASVAEAIGSPKRSLLPAFVSCLAANAEVVIDERWVLFIGEKEASLVEEVTPD